VEDLVNQATSGGGGPNPSNSSPGTNPASNAQSADDSGIQGALVPSTAGRVVYYRVN
jgi:hypothetical protein